MEKDLDDDRKIDFVLSFDIQGFAQHVDIPLVPYSLYTRALK
jgi:hypothetical protein